MSSETPAPTEASPPGPLEGTAWQVVTPSGTRSTIAFAEGRAFGSGGVNRFTGAATATAEGLELGALAVTRMAGPPEAMGDEDAFLAALGSVTAWSIEDGLLLLRDAEGTTRLTLEPEADPGAGATS